MKRLSALVILSALAAASSHARPKSDSFETTHVTLYDCGLAQLEQVTRVSGASKLSIPIQLAHLDDLLASLVLATDGSVKVRGVNFPGVQNLGQAVAASGLANALSEDGEVSPRRVGALAGYARALVGTDVIVTRRRGKPVRGTVLSLAEHQPGGERPLLENPDGSRAPPGPEQTLVIVTLGGEIVWVPLDEIEKLSPSSKRESAAIRNFATQLGQANGFTETAITLETTADSRGRLAASYIRQMPLWRMSYRVTADGNKVTLEAWAIVHNDTTEDWNDVALTLLAGLPKSYVLSLASPRYTEREGLALENDGNLMPQLGAHTPDSLLYDLDSILSVNYSLGGLEFRGTGRGGGGTGEGTIGLHSRGGVFSESGASELASSLVQVGESAFAEQMKAVVEAEISTYTALTTVTIPAGTSSMVPVVHREVEGEAFTLVDGDSAPGTCVRVRNETGLVLQGGLASFQIRGRFRGQTEIRRTEPGDLRVWCFGEDPDVTVETAADVSRTHERLEWRGDALWVHDLKRTSTDYTISNNAGQPRRVAIRVTHIENGRVVAPQKVIPGEEPHEKLYLLDISPRTEHTQRTVVEEGVCLKRPVLDTELGRLSRASSLPADQRGVARRAREALLAADRTKKAAIKQREELSRDEETVARYRTNLESVPSMRGRSRRVDEIVKKILVLETRLEKTRLEIERLEAASLGHKKRAKKTLLELAD